MAARGEDFTLDIDGVERLTCTSASIAPEAACTSVQLHLQVTPARFADVWNAAQAVAAVQIAVGANSPFLFGRELWRESRPPLFQQATDTRPPELQAQGVRPRTWFGERWVDSAYDLFEENLRYFPAAAADLRRGGARCGCSTRAGCRGSQELVLHNGTVYRWNRPVYGVADGVPHLRVENRVLPAGPTVTDVDRQRRLLLRAGARARRGAAAGVDAAALRRRGRPTSTPPAGTASTRELRWPRPGRAGGLARGARRHGSSGTNCCRSPRRGSTPGASSPPTGTSTSASSRSAAGGG